MRVFVTGATGHIGGQVARAAAGRGWAVRGLRRRPGSVGAVGDVDIDWRDGDLSGADALKRAMQGCEVLFHAAAYAPYKMRNIRKAVREATAEMRTVLGAARAAGVGRVVYTGSYATVGPPSEAGRLADERDHYLTGSVDSSYFECKWAMEAECYRAVAEGLPVVVLLPTAVFGPGDARPSTGRLLLEIARGRMPVSVDVPINAVDGRDVAAAHLAAAEWGAPGERYILGGHNVSVPELFALTARLAGRREPVRLPVGLLNTLFDVTDRLRIPMVETVRTLRYLRHFDSGKAQRELGLRARPLEETVRATLDWFGQNGYL